MSLNSRLIDSAKAFSPVYAIYRHEYLGCLISSHVVQELENGRLSLQYQGLNPDNMDQFVHKMDDTDRQLVRLLAQVSGPDLIKRFNIRTKGPQEFFTKQFTGEVQKMVQRFVSRTLEQAIAKLKGKPLYVMATDGYPAHRPAELLEEKASIRFHLDRRDQGTLYYPKISLAGKELRFDRQNADILCDSPAWVMVDNKVFTFDQAVEGRKLQPFLNKGSIVISPQMEGDYFRKFVPQVIEQYDVTTTGMRIVEVREQPVFHLYVDSEGGQGIELKLMVAYANHELNLEPAKAVTVLVEQKGQDYTFFKIHRDTALEQARRRNLEEIIPPQGLLGMHFLDRQAGLGWLSEHIQFLKDLGFVIIHSGEDQNISFEVPEIVFESSESGDWFDIRAMVHIAGFRIPFIRFKGNILRGQRDFLLPDNTKIILPESWFTDYRHLVEIAEERDGDILAIRKYQAVVLDISSEKGDRKGNLSKVIALASVQSRELPLGLTAELRSYQKAGYDWLCFLRELGLGGILADDMGLGKTLQALSLLLSEKEAGSKGVSLVAMPTSLVYNWLAEARKFTPDLRIMVHTGLNRPRDQSAFMGYDVVLTTYGILRSDLEFFKALPLQYLILDESQMIKNPSSKTARAVRELRAKHRLSLTGTPLENSLMDLWSQMDFLNPGLLGSEAFFREYYSIPIEKMADARRSEELRSLLHPFILRRTKGQVANELPPKVEIQLFCEMTDPQREYYEHTKNAYRNYLIGLDAEEFKRKKLNILAGLQKLRQIAIHPALVESDGEFDVDSMGSGKYEEFQRLLEEVIEKGIKVLVFSQFVRVLTMLRKELDSQGVKYCYLDGATRDRQEQVNKFQNDPSVTAFLISLKAGGVGLNLTAAEYVFILDPWWNPAVESQAIDRSHRIGQTKTVFSYKFITRDSIEEKIVRLQERKKSLSNEIVNAEEDVFKQLDMEDLRALLD